jgi:xylulokinase
VSKTQAVLGIDLGTSQLKALIATPAGEILGRGRAAYPVSAPAEGQAETDPEDWWRAARTAVREAVASAAGSGTTATAGGVGTEVAGIAVTGQMHGVVLAGADGRPLRSAILWLDRRAAGEAAEYGGLPARLTPPLGNQPSAGMAGPILRWLTRHEPATVDNARWALQPKDWLRLRMTGEAATDPTDASGTLLFDLPENAWAGELIETLGLPRDKLPDVREPADIAGRLLPGSAAELGLDPGIPVATGAADTAAALYAVYYREPEALLTLGSGGQWVVAEPVFRPAPNTNLFRAVGGGYYRLAAAQNVGTTLDWVRNVLDVSWQHMYDTARRPWRPGTPLFLPYLTQERWDAAATGTWAGLTLAQQRDDLLRAALEGVAFLLRNRLEDLRAAGRHPQSAIIGGGGTRHPAWRQLLADVLGLPLHPAPTTWLSATGAAMIAAAAGRLPRGVSRDRSDDEKETIAPADPDAARASYRRWRIAARNGGLHAIGVSSMIGRQK